MLDEIMLLVNVSEGADDEMGGLVWAFEGFENVGFMDFECLQFLLSPRLSFAAFLLNLLSLFSRCL